MEIDGRWVTPPLACGLLPGVGRALALSQGDLQTLLTRFDQSYNLTPDDLGDLLAAAEEEAIQRRFASITCGQVMSSHLLTITAQTSLEAVADLLRGGA